MKVKCRRFQTYFKLWIGAKEDGRKNSSPILKPIVLVDYIGIKIDQSIKKKKNSHQFQITLK